jgi:hypothetical protein
VRNPRSGDKAARNIISQRLRRARLAFDPPLTQDQLSGRLAAKGIALDRVAMTKIESAQRCVFDFELPVLAEVLRVDVRWLLGIQTAGGPSTLERGEDGL